MKLEKAQLDKQWDAERKKSRRMIWIAALLTLIVFLICLGVECETSDHPSFMPLKYYHSLFTRLGIQISGIHQGAYWHERDNLIQAIGVLDYISAHQRLEITAMAALSGAGLAVAGAIFQTVYKNPMASPNMLGATAGVQLGNVLIVMLYSNEALTMITLRYKWCYLLTAICVGVTLLLGKLAGDRTGNPSVLKMVMAGSVLNQGIGTIAMYYMYRLPDEDLLTYQQISMGTYIDTENVSLLVFFIVMGVSLIPVLLLRYRLNVTAMDDAQARASGVNPAPYRLVAQLCGVLMLTAAMIHCGQAGMLAMVIPFVVRNAVGADFRKVCTCSAFFGAILMMICRTISTCAYIHNKAGDVLLDANLQPVMLPVTFFVNICLLPFFLIILARQRSGFE